MKKFKMIDTWISIVLIPAFVILGFGTMNEMSLYGYFVVGGWQIASMIIHNLNGWFTEKGGERFFYQRLVLILVTSVLALIVTGQLAETLFVPLIIIMLLLLITSPFMAIYYAYMCYQETFIKMKRPMDLLK